MGRTACTEPQCLYRGALYFFTLGYLAPGTTKFLVFLLATKLSVSVSVCLLVALLNSRFSVNCVQYHRVHMTEYALKNIFKINLNLCGKGFSPCGISNNTKEAVAEINRKWLWATD